MAASGTTLRLRVLAAFAAIYLIWGSTYLGIRIAIETLPPLLTAGLRFIVAGPLLYAWARRNGAPRPSGIQWRAAAIVGGLLLLGGNGLVTWAEQRVSSGLAALLVATVPLWMVLLDWLFLRGGRPAGQVFLGLVLGLAGIVLLIGPTDLLGEHRVDLVGVAMMLLAALSWAIGSLYARRAPLPDAPLLGTGMEMIAGGVLLLLASGAKGEWAQVDFARVSLRSWLALAYLTLLGSIVAFTAYTWLLRVSTPARVATYAYVNPVVAVVLGWAVVGEVLTGHMLLAAVVIVLAVVVITTGRARDS
ncbi:MAG: drug/metabolite exporter YedA [Anaerolineae bacterium]|nr:drug/metabolite exporter YedA [Anaerolineae bacterium]